ncbi:hypothetical protein YTPLAS72_12930 [Nitrospira sp.]|nr:hypothetical protein YTPLAS72_12930 [Nitrospira sp.]
MKSEFREGVLDLSSELGEGETKSHRCEGSVSRLESCVNGTKARLLGGPFDFLRAQPNSLSYIELTFLSHDSKPC